MMQRQPTIRVVDDRGKALCFERPPARIVSLVPSDTYNLIQLGMGDRLVGRTRYCVAPAPEVAAIPDVGGTKDADLAAILSFEPDLVVANQEENTEPLVRALEQRGVPVLVAFPRRVIAGAAHAARLARLLGEPSDTARFAMKAAYAALREAEAFAASIAEPVPTFVPIWMDPLMTAHGDTFLSDVLRLCGARNVFAERARRYPLAADLGRAPPVEQPGRDTRYPRVTLAEVCAQAPALMLLPDEPHAFTDADVATLRQTATPAAEHDRIVRCAGQDLLWPGLRSLEGLAALRKLIGAVPS